MNMRQIRLENGEATLQAALEPKGTGPNGCLNFKRHTSPGEPVLVCAVIVATKNPNVAASIHQAGA